MNDRIVNLPLLPLRDVVVFPYMVISLFVGREKSIRSLDQAMASNKEILLLTQKTSVSDDPGAQDLYGVGTVASILQMLKLPDGTVKILVEGRTRARVKTMVDTGTMASLMVEKFTEETLGEREAEAINKDLLSHFEQYAQLSKKIPTEVTTALTTMTSTSQLVDTIASHMNLRLELKQKLLEADALIVRIDELMGIFDDELELLQMEKRIRGRVKKQMERSQREYYLNEQIKAIHKELGDLDEVGNEWDEIKRKVDNCGMTSEAHVKATNELNKLKNMSPMSAEATVVRTYLDWLTQVPWKSSPLKNLDLKRAEKVLDDDHYGLEDVKTRILEYLAVQKRVRKLKSPVLCLVGPPGVGKTSLAESIAKATQRKYVRMALGGVRDEAEIRGHRRTYIGSMPGRLIQKMCKVGSCNPLFLLDEIDKMGQDMRGDPASALLEVLDPEQNHAFNDHYLEVDYDLSEVLFVCTANSMNVPEALLDRMEIIRLSGYTEDEKFNIAKKYLVPKQQKAHGMTDGELSFEEDALLEIIRHYTREAGVRELERQIAKVNRKIVKLGAGKKNKNDIKLDASQIETYLGVRKYRHGLAEIEDVIGQVTGLAWTKVGGELLSIEAAVVPGKGQLIKTGSLGDVMGESITAALTVVRSRHQALGIPSHFYEKQDIHIHVPEGATPKDGPSAGIGMCTALVSALTQIPVRSDVAMTGEITLRGQVLAIGGLKEKLLAAHRGSIKRVIIPVDNEKDLKEIPSNILDALEIIPVKWIDDVLTAALRFPPTPLEISSTDISELPPTKTRNRPSAH